MDRTVFAACARILVPFGLVVGCGTRPAPDPPDSAPLVLAELQAASPGPWRREGRAPIAMTSLERAGIVPYANPAPENPADVEDIERRLQARRAPLPLEREPALADRQDANGNADARLRFANPDTANPAVENVPQPPLHGATIEAASPAESSTPEIEHGAGRTIGTPRTLEPLPTPAQTAIEPAPADVVETPEHVALPWANAPPRSPELVPVIQEAERHVRQGFRLAERNALHLARAEFIAALELIAEANDVQQNTQFYTEVLSAGLTALAESHDFVRQRPVGKKVDLARLVSGHKTPILKNSALDRLAPTVAAGRYYTYAQEQLAGAAAGEACGSQALFGLGRVTISIAEAHHVPRLESNGQAMSLYQAALMADARNFRAANELGVILAYNRDYVRARDLLVHSVRLCPHPSTYRNLAAVQAKLGETNLAEQSKAQSLAMEQAGYCRSGPAVRWVDPDTFASAAPASDSVLPPVAQPSTLPANDTNAPAKEPPVSTAKRGITDWLPWNPRR